MGKAVSRGAPQADGSLKNEAMMDVKHVGDAIVYMDSLPLEANVQFMTVMATTDALYRAGLAAQYYCPLVRR